MLRKERAATKTAAVTVDEFGKAVGDAGDAQCHEAVAGPHERGLSRESECGKSEQLTDYPPHRDACQEPPYHIEEKPV